MLEAAGLVTRGRKGRESRFACRAGALDAARAHLNRVEAAWEDALARLAAQLRDDSGLPAL